MAAIIFSLIALPFFCKFFISSVSKSFKVSLIKEVNPSYFCFESKWLWKNLEKLKTDNVQKEYYLTDLVKIAMQDKEKIESVDIDPQEALGVNSRAELEILEKLGA